MTATSENVFCREAARLTSTWSAAPSAASPRSNRTQILPGYFRLRPYATATLRRGSLFHQSRRLDLCFNSKCESAQVDPRTFLPTTTLPFSTQRTRGIRGNVLTHCCDVYISHTVKCLPVLPLDCAIPTRGTRKAEHTVHPTRKQNSFHMYPRPNMKALLEIHQRGRSKSIFLPSQDPTFPPS